MFSKERWEYTILEEGIPIKLNSVLDLEKRLNELGRQGFELVSVITDKNENKQFYFKRRI